MYKLNNLFFEYEDNLTLKEVIKRNEDNKKILPQKGFGSYVFVNKKKIEKENFGEIIINDRDEIVIMPLMGAG